MLTSGIVGGWSLAQRLLALSKLTSAFPACMLWNPSVYDYKIFTDDISLCRIDRNADVNVKTEHGVTRMCIKKAKDIVIKLEIIVESTRVPSFQQADNWEKEDRHPHRQRRHQRATARATATATATATAATATTATTVSATEPSIFWILRDFDYRRTWQSHLDGLRPQRLATLMVSDRDLDDLRPQRPVIISPTTSMTDDLKGGDFGGGNIDLDGLQPWWWATLNWMSNEDLVSMSQVSYSHSFSYLFLLSYPFPLSYPDKIVTIVLRKTSIARPPYDALPPLSVPAVVNVPDACRRVPFCLRRMSWFGPSVSSSSSRGAELRKLGGYGIVVC